MEAVRKIVRRESSQRGMTLVELLVALIIGAVLITLVFQFLNVESNNFLQSRSNSEMQQELRWAMQFVSAHVRLAGNIVPQVLISDTGVKVIDNVDGAGGAPDSLSILGSFRSVVITLDQTMGNEGAQIKCSDKANTPPESLADLFAEGDLAFISDGTYSEVFQITRIQADHLYHETSPPWNDDNKLDHRYAAGSTLSTVTNYSFYVKADDTGRRNLMVKSQAWPEQVLAGDVEDFQVRFKMKSGVWKDTIEANEITLNEIRHVEITMRTRSAQPIRGYRDPKYGDAYKHMELKGIIIPKSIAVM
jgi:type IV pilus assembly protein PilW